MRKPLSGVNLKRILNALPSLTNDDFTNLIQAMSIEVSLRKLMQKPVALAYPDAVGKENDAQQD